MSEIDPTDHALATIASILEDPEPGVIVREIEIIRETEVVVGEQPAAEEHGAVDIARGLRQALKEAGIEVAPFKRGA